MTSPIGGTSYTAATTTTQKTAPTTQTTSTTGLKSDDFLKLLIAQIKFQDPTSPTDPAQFMSQTAQLTQVDVLNKLAAQQETLLTSTVSARAADLVGKNVEYLDADGIRHTGVVDSATFGSDPTVRIGKTDVALSALTAVSGRTA
ncbi:hypothetical protein GCM10022243_41110 [Saccharothrix violaceirubra]|uniref:Flagellar basal-body rod modification protein FlgD n=1 Tax=Saccharothrix violaceirubra TaxID=413306 RepID=A0A7W7T9B7_9PSEU|nr:flagellar hook capping FlgD N-terminal domain-containing protein [Saccharothrix violaceirubra]MBB4968367.1 flagellar basal-body rod modification protein FlgD [Saccharothrix violaceirubra]